MENFGEKWGEVEGKLWRWKGIYWPKEISTQLFVTEYSIEVQIFKIDRRSYSFVYKITSINHL